MGYLVKWRIFILLVFAIGFLGNTNGMPVKECSRFGEFIRNRFDDCSIYRCIPHPVAFLAFTSFIPDRVPCEQGSGVPSSFTSDMINPCTQEVTSCGEPIIPEEVDVPDHSLETPVYYPTIKEIQEVEEMAPREPAPAPEPAYEPPQPKPRPLFNIPPAPITPPPAPITPPPAPMTPP
ncbi:unnamed protein product, partial [Owenia fusiformis]